MKRKNKLHKVFILYPGFAEEGANSALILEHNIGFKTINEAFSDLGKKLVEANDVLLKLKKCCHQHENNNFNFCPICGTKLQKESITDGDIRYWFRDIAFNSVESTAKVFDQLEDQGWCIPCLNPNKFINGYVVVYFAEELITSAYFGTKPSSDCYISIVPPIKKKA